MLSSLSSTEEHEDSDAHDDNEINIQIEEHGETCRKQTKIYAHEYILEHDEH